MRYFSRPVRDTMEAAYIPPVFGKTYEPLGQLTLGADTRLDSGDVDLVDVDGETLAIQADSASWAFLTAGEAALLGTLRQHRTFGEIAAAWPAHAGGTPLDFVAHLYRRGLVRIEGRAAVDRTLFADGSNYDEGHLVELLVTEKCNLACPYCLAGAHRSMPSMSREMALRTIDLAFAMPDCATLAFEFAGGEPFLMFPLMRELVRHIQTHPLAPGKRLFLSVQTNATLLDEERVRWLRDNDIRVGISLDGTPQSQNESRPQVNGKGSFARLARGIELLHRFAVPFGGLVVLNRSNIAEPERLADFMLEAGVNGFRLNPVAFLGDARRNWERVGATQEEIVAFFKTLMSYIAGRRLMLLEDNVRSMCDFLTSRQRRTRCMRTDCGAGDTFQSIAANGDIYPCGRATQSPGLRLGNIFDPELGSLSAPALKHPIIAMIRDRRPESLSDCVTCHYRQLCQSGCSVQAWERHATVRAKTPECAFYKTMYPYLMRWLSFDAAAFDHLEQCSYFNNEGVRFHHDFLPADRGAMTAADHAQRPALWTA